MGEIRPLHLEMGARGHEGLKGQWKKQENRSSESVRNGWLGCDCSESQLIRDSLTLRWKNFNSGRQTND